jgi:hypothetical protein
VAEGATAALDTAIGAFAALQKVAAETTQRTVRVFRSTGVSRVVTGVAGGTLRVTKSAAEPLRVRGSATRTRLTTDARARLPDVAATTVQRVLDIVSLDDIMRRIDVDGIIRRVDIDALVARVDLNALLARIDVDEIVERVDLDALVERTDLGAVIAQSTGGVASGAVDLVRRQGVGLDGWVAGWAARVRRRDANAAPAGPPLLAGDGGP